MYYETRAHLTHRDREFIVETIGKTSNERSALTRLMDDPFTVTELLHNKQLFERSMTSPPHFIPISSQLFFYLFVYQALDRKHIADDDVVDYVSGICVEFRSSDSAWHFNSPGEGKSVFLVDLLKLMETIDKAQQYYLRRYIGNVTLFLTGFFPDFIFHRSKTLGAPSIKYYESIGRSQYESAVDDSKTYDAEAGPVLETLANRFVEIRSAINIFNDSYLHLNSHRHSLEAIERQAATLDEESFRQSLES